MKIALSLLACILLSISVKATYQARDILIWNTDTLSLFSNPLELRSDWKELYKKISIAIENEDKRLYPKKYEKKEVEVLFSTACWRGYIAEWEIINSQIYLNNIYACQDKNVRIDLKKILPKEFNNGLIFANWINGKLRAPKGVCLEWLNLDYNSIYEKELVLEFKNGILTEFKTFSNSIEKKSNFSKDKNPNNFLNFVYSHIHWDKLPDFKNKHIQTFVGIQPNREGKLDSIIWEYTYLLDESGIITDRNNLFIKEAIRIAELIPDWDVIYQRGLIVKRSLMIIFDENNRVKYTK